MQLDGIKMNVVETDPSGVVNRDTVFSFTHKDDTISAEYTGGEILKGYLVGTLKGDTLDFSYCQKQQDGKLDFGESSCKLSRDEEGKIILIEEFEWKSRPGIKGKNVFKEI